jgi:hypothetical protein
MSVLKENNSQVQYAKRTAIFTLSSMIVSPESRADKDPSLMEYDGEYF